MIGKVIWIGPLRHDNKLKTTVCRITVENEKRPSKTISRTLSGIDTFELAMGLELGTRVYITTNEFQILNQEPGTPRGEATSVWVEVNRKTYDYIKGQADLITDGDIPRYIYAMCIFHSFMGIGNEMEPPKGMFHPVNRLIARADKRGGLNLAHSVMLKWKKIVDRW